MYNKIPKDVDLYKPGDIEYDLQRWWRDNPPIFSLRERRQQQLL
jgi:hypothetical protein